MDTLIEQFVKLNTKLNRKLQLSQTFFYIFFIAFLMESEMFELCLLLLPFWQKRIVLMFENVETFAVKDEFGIVIRRNDVTPDNTN